MAAQDRFAHHVYTLVCWGALILAAMFLYSILSNLHFPPSITVVRKGKIDEYSWGTFIGSIVINSIGLYIGITTKLGERRPNDLGYVLRRGAKITGWIIGVGGWFGTLHLLAILLRWTPPPQ